MGDRIDLSVLVAALPDHGIGIAFRADLGRLEQAAEEAEQIAAFSLGPRDFHEIKHIRYIL
jgi:hypothetical protein